MPITIDKAIEILSDLLYRYDFIDAKETHAAVQLGIEALERIQDIRHTIYSDLTSLLPGETEK